MSDNDPMTELAMSAAQLHEIFTELCAAGFAANEALYLLACILDDKSPDTKGEL